ncbi:glycosyltransferase family 10 domain-containing protein [Flavobacterium hiemivividum]|uniref:Glycosyltransferase n=1 Tax=Flavobacterium hiemivividum TaxID=2541734 RepID=A0A4R5CV33_9FLAO|nr:glycosyltransferase family 10 [Flavobacterium hiemivividum]TDE04572.1 glycosyltransferase [Flavobacterium hiemivividum]
MKEIKIDFVDFWPGFDKTNNYFYNILIEKYKVIIDDKPDFLFYSCYGKDYLNYKCIRIFYSAENLRPDFSACDFAFSFDYNNRNNHFRLPLYSLYVEKRNMQETIESVLTRVEAEKKWRAKTKFCCMLVSNPKATKRLKFFKNLSKVKQVDSGGTVLNNVGGPVYDKLDFIKDYKFVIAFENSQYDGYTTEKLIEPIFKDCIPIYWGNKLVEVDFNPNRILNYSQFKSEKELIDRIVEIDQNDELAIQMLMQPVFSLDRVSYEEERQQVLAVLNQIFESVGKPIAQQPWKYIHLLKEYYIINKKRVLRRLN